MTGNLALKLVEGTKKDRDQYIDRVDVLDKVKKIIMLPDEYIESKKVAEYFGVNATNIRMVVSRHENEFTKNEILKLKGKDLVKYKEKLTKSHNVTLIATAHLTLFTRRGVLRLGMLLTNSPVASKIRDYLLTIEEKTHNDQKQLQDVEKLIVESMYKNLKDGMSKNQSFIKIAEELGVSKATINARWHGIAGYKIALKNIEPQPEAEINNNSQYITELAFSNENNSIAELLNEVKALKASNENLHSDMGKLWRGYMEMSDLNKDLYSFINNEIKSIKEGLNSIKNDIEVKHKDKVDYLEKKIENQSRKIKLQQSEIQKTKMILADQLLGEKPEAITKNQSFKMERNGNLTRV